MNCAGTKKIGYVYSRECLQLVNFMPRIPGRAMRVHSLIQKYGLLDHMRIYEPVPASDQDILAFHSSDFLEYIKTWSQEHIIGSGIEDHEDVEDDVIEMTKEEDRIAEEFGFGYDCPMFQNILPYIRHVGGSSITAAKAIMDDGMDCVINWFGGWHHAKRDHASGYCYVNDIVLCIITLLKKFTRVLYIDLDLHHGDGVEEAFWNSNKVMTLSFHKHADGFFPGSGSHEDVGAGRGSYHAVNVPLKSGLDDQMFCNIFDEIFSTVNDVFPYEVVVCQSGCDALSGDPMKGFNWTCQSFLHVAESIRKTGKPTIFLGGGGYEFPNVARCWTILTAAMCGLKIDLDLPDHEFFMEYGPGFDLSVNLIPMYNRNHADYVANIINILKTNLHHI